ncbi:MAG: hypothetical protein PVJ49_15010 [Acidobacteriota bacterium]|jgi:hypothetical protein
MTRQTPHAAEEARLSALLEQRRDELESIEGVIATGVGLVIGSVPERVVIKVFVRAPNLIDEVQAAATEIMGPEIPLETEFLPIPAGDRGQNRGG